MKYSRVRENEESQLTHLPPSAKIDAGDQDIIVSLFRSPWPVSIDAICSLSSSSPTKVLNVLEKLNKKKLIYQKKGLPKHTYFVNGLELANYVKRSIMNAEEAHAFLRRIINFCNQSFVDGEEKTLLLAGLYRMVEDSGDGLPHIKNAADLLLASGNREGAISHYNYLLDRLKGGISITRAHAPYLIDSILGKISLMRHDIPFVEQASLLENAQCIAKRYKLWDRFAETTLVLGELHTRTAWYDKTSQCIRDFQSILKHVSDRNLHRVYTYLTCELLMMNGQISQVTQKYDEVVGDLEKFGDNEIALRAIANVGMCYVLSGRFARGMGLIDGVRSKAIILNRPQVIVLADLIAVLCLLEVRKLAEAESRLNRTLSFSDDVITPFGLRGRERFRAFIHLSKKEYAQADECLKRYIEYSRELGQPPVKTPWLFELLDALEKHGFEHEEISYDGELERMLKGNDLHMKGAAYRYRALRNLERHVTSDSVIDDLKQSEKYLKKAGAEIELARTRVDLARIYLQKKDFQRARSCLTSAWAVFSRVDKCLFPKDLLPFMPQEYKTEFMIDRMIAIDRTLGTANELSSFLEQAINLAIDLSMATRGAFFTVEDINKPVLKASRNFDPQSHEEEHTGIVLDIVSRTVVENAEVVVPEQAGRRSIQAKTLFKAGITSQVCMPIKPDQHVLGYLYLDNPVNGEPFSRESLAYLRLLCSRIALGLSNILESNHIRNIGDHYKQEATFYKKQMGITAAIDTIVGVSDGIKRVMDQIHQVAPTGSTVLITGETGTGKELVAKAIHNLSERRDGPFIPINIAAFPVDLVASELFGHEKGAFTGAHEQYRGRFELANGGTLFLDEIGDLPLNVQVKLLRVLDEGIFERLGSSKRISSNFRIVAASNRDLFDEARKGVFREDLYYRLNVFPIYIPPLRDRKEDILPLVHHFIRRFSRKLGKRIGIISNQEMNKLLSYHWPGNVRELEHFIERALILSSGSEISFSGLETITNETLLAALQQSMSLDDVERSHIEKVLTMTRWRVNGPKGAASLLGLKPSTLFFRMKKLGIKRTPARPMSE